MKPHTIVKTFESAHRTVLGVHGAGKAHDVVFRCTLDVSQADRWLEVPAWTFDRTACPDAKLLTAQPFASIECFAALLDLALEYRTSSAVVQSAVAEVSSAI
ncbi:hypothetical protein IVA86_40895 [Bradyrhizobium sp. 146]|uniref:hypothetical protein n=1 Tax=Bradyrhizobium sp. 146 TaxID=2782622 RepID=UPI001FF75007|nr:hypothetical protein [Bradyrhizobium sp. 146]MCK1345271.1 hypothetical protein [Bradyrhizobium sp. CW11]MCK1707588.1 hypothetical protein [Bradyrhizobium sp. 146]